MSGSNRLHIPPVARPGEQGIREWIRQAATIWNSKLSQLADDTETAQLTAEDAAASAANALEQVPATGDFRLLTSNSYGSEWLPCDGSAVSRVTYAALFAVIGTTYGNGDGATTFNLPTIKAFILDNSSGFSLDTLEKGSWTIVIRT